MQAKDIEKIIENKYSLLLFFLVLLSLISILTANNAALLFYSESVLSMAVFVILLKILKASRFFFAFYIGIALFALLFHYLAVFVLQNGLLAIAAMLGYILMVGTMIAFMIRRVFSEKMVTSDTIKGGISIYILLGVWWRLIYGLIWTLNPDSFTFVVDQGNRPDFLYFSITTMTTLGYGDILPKTFIAKAFSMYQVLTGQIYLAVFVARLVGMHTARHWSKK